MFIVVPRAQAARIRKALAQLEGYPARGVAYGVEDRSGTQPGPGWTTEATAEPDDDGSDACIEIPAQLEKHLGKTVKVGAANLKLPAAEALTQSEDELPATLKAIKQARRDAALVNNKATSENSSVDSVRAPKPAQPIGKSADTP